MFSAIYRFELRYQLRSPLFWIGGALLFLLTFMAVTTDVVTVGGAIGKVNRNAPFVILQMLLVMSILGLFVAIAFVAGSVLRDYESRTHELFLTTRASKAAYLGGRLLGSYSAAACLYLPVALAIFLGSLMPWLDPERIGPFALAPYIFSFSVIVLPNLLLMSAIFFALATLTRSLLYSYAGLVAIMVGYLVSQSLLTNLETEKLAVYLDPFGAGALDLVTKYWTTVERNSLVPQLDGALLLNRLLWLSVAIALLATTYKLFSFSVEGRQRRRKVREEEPAPVAVAAGTETFAPRARTVPSTDSSRVSGSQFRRIARYETLGVLKSLPFLIILAMGVLNQVGSSSVVDLIAGTPVYPRTHLMIQVIQGSFLMFAVLIMTFYAGELVFRERQLRLDEVYDALPVKTWVLWAAKLVSLVAIVGVLLTVSIVAGIGIQLYRGYTHFELGLYLSGVYLYIGVPFLLVAVLALFCQVVTHNKYIGFLLMVLYYISNPVMDALDFQQNLYRYARAPLLAYSDMNGFGHGIKPAIWFYTYWAFLAGLLLIAIHLLWVRGKETSLRIRLATARARLTSRVRVVGSLLTLGFIGVGGFIFYNTNILNDYLPNDVIENRQARFEKDYKQYEGILQPKVVAVSAEVDIFPDRRAADIRTTYRLRNKTSTPIDQLHLTLPTIADVERAEVPGAVLESDDREVGYRIYHFDEPLEPGQEIELRFEIAARNPGFVNHGSNTRLVYNGSFINAAQYFPNIGYSRAGQLVDPVERRRHGLPPIERARKLEDEKAWNTHMLGAAADWIDFEATVSTSADQIALAPGYLEREWEEGGRRYFHYAMDAPILAYFAFLSARWDVATDHWNDVDIAVYYHPDHRYNVDKMIAATKAGLDYYSQQFGPYQHKQFRIIEFPRYETFAEAFPNTIPFSESIGFIARLDDPDDVDYVTYVTAHELAHQWWAHQVIPAGVQGATVMVETMAQYSALMVMERRYGAQKMRRFLKYELDRYLRGRGGELIEELPLMRVEFQPYIHYRKGSLATYALRDAIGDEPLNHELARFIADFGFRGPPYPTTKDFLAYVEGAVPESQRQLLDDLFRHITLYELRTQEASWKKMEDGRYAVTLSTEAHKFRADGLGVETEIPIDDTVDIAVFGERGKDDPPEGKVLFFDKRRISTSDPDFELIVDEEPRRAGIDPYNKLVDRNPENNLKTATAG